MRRMTMSKQKRDKMNLFKKFLLGGAVGFVLAIILILLERVTINLNFIIDYSLYAQIAVIGIFLIPSVFCFYKAKRQFRQMDESIDVDSDPHRENAEDRKSTRLNSSHVAISYAVFCLKKKTKNNA